MKRKNKQNKKEKKTNMVVIEPEALTFQGSKQKRKNSVFNFQFL